MLYLPVTISSIIIKVHMLIPWGVMTSHIRSIIGKIHWKLANIALVIDAIHERIIREEIFHI